MHYKQSYVHALPQYWFTGKNLSSEAKAVPTQSRNSLPFSPLEGSIFRLQQPNTELNPEPVDGISHLPRITEILGPDPTPATGYSTWGIKFLYGEE